jgi:hypothetical protein
MQSGSSAHSSQRVGSAAVAPGKRRVDVDDLVALAIAFEVSPTTLLLPWTASGVVHLTNTVEADAVTAWEWTRGIRPVELPEDRYEADFAEEKFQRDSAPRGARPKQTRAGRRSRRLPEDDEVEAFLGQHQAPP